MNKTKKVLFVSIIMLIVGMVLIFIGICLGGAISSITYSSDGIKINTVKSSANQVSSFKEETISLDGFDAIDIEMAFGDFIIQESDHFELYYKMDTRYDFQYKLEGNTLKINQNASSSKQVVLFGTFSMNSESQVIVSVPKGTKLNKITADLDSVETGISEVDTSSLDLSLTFGNLNLKNSNLGDTILDTDSVNISVENISCKNLSIDNSFGNLKGTNLSVENEARFILDSCNIKLEATEFGSLYSSNNFGKVEFEGLDSPTITLDFDSVDVNIKELISSQIEIENNFGDIELEFAEDVSEYAYEITTDFGKIVLGDTEVGSAYVKQGKAGDDSSIKIACDSGSVNIK